MGPVGIPFEESSEDTEGLGLIGVRGLEDPDLKIVPWPHVVTHP